MKKVIALFLALFLLQSCFSYKTVDFSTHQFVTDKKYKVILKDSSKIKGTLINYSENDITIKPKNAETSITLEKSDMTKIGVRKFSFLKSGVLLYLGVAAVVGTATAFLTTAM